MTDGMTTTTTKFCAEQAGTCPNTCCGPHVCTAEVLNHTEPVHECECGYLWGPAKATTATIDETHMWSEHIAAHADKVAGVQGDKCWKASWMPQRLLDRNQAITAMMIADEVARGIRFTGLAALGEVSFLMSLCQELELDVEDAARMVRVDQACTSGFVTLSVSDRETGEWQRIRHIRTELVDEGLLLRVLGQNLAPADLDELDKPIRLGDAQPGEIMLVRLVDAFGTLAIEFTAEVGVARTTSALPFSTIGELCDLIDDQQTD